MKTAIFCTISDPVYWQYAFKEAVDCYSDLVDEVVVVDGSLNEFSLVQELCRNKSNVKYIRSPWPYDFDWIELPRHIQLGFENVSRDVDVAIKMDIDYLIHENDKLYLKAYCKRLISNEQRVGALKKFTVYTKASGFQKAIVPVVVNMKYRDTLLFGKDKGNKTDWCFPVDSISRESIEPYEPSGIYIYNYDYFFRTKERACEAFYRFSKAGRRDFGHNEWGGTLDESSQIVFDRYKGMGRRSMERIRSHPKWIEHKVKNITENERGYNNWEL